ncbi:glycolate oxidase FAD binding subunit [Candidatus Nitrosoglobus terrae]|uniref:Glycolate oxidase FAD binding subunit n=1 Tax=Candidatus Nitrosoglobus terrae TaxID=1630141 RepID=A0A1Q2SMA9_9GAMM|nr:glycolate oxidase subunit GlcE [Candidatus Nitrosoglobus terrae]BAW80278.1 glycolate oxidase FAD binding subunit [Candidatus Nitrosoglobus terrae]
MNTDYSQVIQEAIFTASDKKTPLCIVGGNTKAFYGRQLNATALDISKHQGIIDYEPAELVLTARAGTPLAIIEPLLADQGQMLAFEPPYFGTNATLGGAVASGISGPRRPYAGAIRDTILGVQIINGKGQKLHFGGQVMKNVAGYDVSRLMAGSLGTLGVLLEISLKVLPHSTGEITLSQEQSEDNAIKLFNTWMTQRLPLSACTFDGKRLYVRLSGSEEAIQSARRNIGGDEINSEPSFWEQIRDLTHKFFQQNTKPLWRWSVPAATPPINLPGKWMIDWGGAQRWFYPDELTAELIYATAEKLNGHATLFRGGDRAGEVFHPLPHHLMILHQRLKQAFDPHGILNPRRMYREL